MWAVREASPSDLFTKQSQDAGHTLEWQEFNSVPVFLSMPRCPHTGLFLHGEHTALGTTHILRLRMVILLEDLSLFGLQCDPIPGFSLCLEF